MSREYGRHSNVKSKYLMVRLTDKQHRKLKETAENLGESVSDYVREQLCIDSERLSEDEDFYE